MGIKLSAHSIFFLKVDYITGMYNVSMNYVDHDKSIIQRYCVKLVGWPDGVKSTRGRGGGGLLDLLICKHAAAVVDVVINV